MILLVGLAVLVLGTVSRAENTTCSSNCWPSPENTTQPCNITSGDCLFGCLPGYAGLKCSVECPSNCSKPLQNNTETCNATTKECLHGCQPGFSGQICSYDCPEKCKISNDAENETCDSNTGECLLGCEYGYAGTNCTFPCPASCGISTELYTQTCNETSGHCSFGCVQRYGGLDCLFVCPATCVLPAANNSVTCDSITGECSFGCIPGYAGPNCSVECPSDCSQPLQNNTEACNYTTGECLHGCKPGNAGPNCTYLCPTSCLLPKEGETETCNFTSGECIHGCKKGYAGPTCSVECQAHCTFPAGDDVDTCNSTTGDCLHGCNKGYTGPDCSVECPANCTLPSKDGLDTCNYSTGDCLNGCEDGYAGLNCSFKCPSNCMFPSENGTDTCNDTTEECIHGCNHGFAGPNCSVECPQNCAASDKSGEEICNATSGECLFGCTGGFYGPNCAKLCDGTDTNCETCVSKEDKSGIVCTKCKRNFYQGGNQCKICNYFCLVKTNETLPTCRENDGYCEFGCREGYFQDKCDRRCKNLCDGPCHRVTGACLKGCTNFQYCGPTCELVCEDGCVSQHCNQTCNCVEGCKPNRWGGKCAKFCNKNCIKPTNSTSAICDSISGTCLLGCNGNLYWGDHCEDTCSDGCLNGTCQQNSGNCTEGCTSTTVYGLGCDIPCNKNCRGGTCERSDGSCNNGCSEGSYGEKCDESCNKNCLNGTCRRDNGHCDSGCLVGSYGDQCDFVCSDKCLYKKCERADGNCTDGCISGYEGIYCENVMPITTPPTNGFPGDTWVYVAIGCAALVALGVMVTIVLVTKKRRQIAKRRRTARLSTLPDEKVLEEAQRRQKHKAEGAGARLTQLFVENPLARYMRYRSHGGDLITKVSIKEILGRVIKMDENDFNREFEDFKTGLTKPHEASRKIDNLALNFFNGIYPYDENRVTLRHSFDEEDVRRKSKAKRGILKSVHFTTFRPNRDSNYETLEVDTKDSDGKKKKQNDKNVKRKGKGGSDGYASVVFNIKDETGVEGLLNQDVNEDTDPYATVGINGSQKPSTSGTDEPCDYAKVTKDDSTELPVDDLPDDDDDYNHVNRGNSGKKRDEEQNDYAHVHKDTNSPYDHTDNNQAVETDQTKDDNNCEYAVVHKDTNDANDHADNNHTGERSKTDQTKADDENCDYAVVHKGIDTNNTRESVNDGDNQRRKPDVAKEEKDGTITIKKDYINASFIKGYNTNEKYIAAQAPSKLTASDFWTMAWEQKSSFIIMMTEIPEEGYSRCEKYWPDLDKEETYGDITISCYDCSQYADYTIRFLKMSLKNGHEREIVHLQFTAWPEEGCPVSAIDLIQFHQKYRSLTKGRHGTGPTIVHCTAGVGRTGVFIALDILVEEGLDTLNVDVYKCVNALREQRVAMVHSIDQFEFLYKVVAQTFALEVQPCHKLRLQEKLTELKKFDHDSGKSKLELLYQNLKASLILDTAEIATVDVVQERKRKDRPTSDVPDVLFRPDLPQDIYINAVIFESLKKKEAMVATQMPTPDTLQDFCQLLVYHQCATVIMLNTLDPNDKTNGIYWPTAKTPVVAGKMIISQLNIEKESDYIVRQLRIHTPETSESIPAQEVNMIQYKGWKIVKNVPNAKNLLKFLLLCQRYIKDLPDKRLLVHCMNGAEQSGLICALVNLFEMVDTEDEVSVTSVARKILARRPNALPTSDQFEMCFAATCEYIKKA